MMMMMMMMMMIVMYVISSVGFIYKCRIAIQPYSTKHDDRKFDKVLAIATDLSNSFPTNLFSYNNPFVSKFSSSNVYAT